SILAKIKFKFEKNHQKFIFDDFSSASFEFMEKTEEKLKIIDGKMTVNSIDDVIKPTILKDGSLRRRCFKSCEDDMRSHQAVADMKEIFLEMYAV
ncbi:MAG: hypothetical protein V4629_10070, partial [Pseudomonadota bacterium]